MAEALGDGLLALARRTQAELLLVAPYIKAPTLARVLDAGSPGVAVKVVTRWRIDEIAAGVSDLAVWPLLRDRGAELWLHPNLHAKYYRGDAVVLIGSANLTDTALGWRPDPNLEILLESPDAGEAHPAFERALWSRVRAVDDALHAAFVRALEAFPPLPPPAAPDLEPEPSFDAWRPQLRFPADLWQAYGGGTDLLTLAAREATAIDLAALAPPPGLDRRQFEAWIGLQLRQHPEMQAIDAFLSQSRRFGEVRDLLAQRGAADGDRAWQSWMRWLLHFLPHDYEMKVANYSEIFRKRGAPEAVRR